MEHGLLIGEVATRSGVSRKALRLYEARGILLAPHRTPSGYRAYSTDVLGLLTFVGRARRLGLTLGQIAHVVALRRAGATPCIHVRQLLEQKVAALEALLGELRQTLSSWRADSGRLAAVCPHIEGKGGVGERTCADSGDAEIGTAVPRRAGLRQQPRADAEGRVCR